jgi:hypothetical protein
LEAISAPQARFKIANPSKRRRRRPLAAERELDDWLVS